MKLGPAGFLMMSLIADRRKFHEHLVELSFGVVTRCTHHQRVPVQMISDESGLRELARFFGSEERILGGNQHLTFGDHCV